MSGSRNLVLGSSSRHRRALLDRLRIPYVVDSPDIDETALEGEEPTRLVERLSRLKAEAVGARHADAVVIGSDQVAVIDGDIVGKPGDHARASAQLARASGAEVLYLTGLCVLDTRSGQRQEACVEVRIGYRELTEREIDAYLRVDQPYDCAGALRAEGAGISLLRYVRTDDPSALIGLPLITLSRFLDEAGIDVLAEAGTAPGA